MCSEAALTEPGMFEPVLRRAFETGLARGTCEFGD
jgi:hypothetical protein